MHCTVCRLLRHGAVNSLSMNLVYLVHALHCQRSPDTGTALLGAVWSLEYLCMYAAYGMLPVPTVCECCVSEPLRVCSLQPAAAAFVPNSIPLWAAPVHGMLPPPWSLALVTIVSRLQCIAQCGCHDGKCVSVYVCRDGCCAPAPASLSGYCVATRSSHTISVLWSCDAAEAHVKVRVWVVAVGTCRAAFLFTTGHALDSVARLPLGLFLVLS